MASSWCTIDRNGMSPRMLISKVGDVNRAERGLVDLGQKVPQRVEDISGE